MNCIVTAGPTYEPLDDVRRLTNFSTGRLGTELANFLCARGHRVTLLVGQQATWRGERQAHEVAEFSTTADLRERLRGLAAGPVDALFHTAAVSDFRCGTVWARSGPDELVEVKAGKISSRLEGLVVELLPTPKIILELRDWFPSACLVGWKYEVDGNRISALARAGEQIRTSRTDACVVNGPAYGAGFGVVSATGHCLGAESREELFRGLAELAAQKGK